MEWNQPSGETEASGGIAVMRISAFREVQGFNATLIAGEEPELCLRLRRRGWKVWRLANDMALHDAQMTRFSQWWTRSIRAGHAYAEGSWLHGGGRERHWVKESRSIWLWGLILPLLALSLAGWTYGLSILLLLCLYGLQVYRVYRYMRGRQFTSVHSLLYAIFCILGKFPQIQGQLRFHFDRLMGYRSPVIEYKAGFHSLDLNASEYKKAARA
ncbi:MAG: glycosyltransferase family 2 protein [Geitlerinemataceae cyanobacterium]